VIEKDCIVRFSTQHLLRLNDVVSDIEEITFETSREPLVSSLVVIKEKYTDRMAFGFDGGEPKLG